MDENTFKVSVNPTSATPPSTPPTSSAPSATPPQTPPASSVPSAPKPTPPVINTQLNVQLDKSVDTQLGRLGGAESKLLSTKSYLIIGILIIALAAVAYGAYIFFFATESATEENFEDITLTNKLGGSENSTKTTESPASKTSEETSPPSLTINLSEEDLTDTANSTATNPEINAPNTPTTSTTPKVPR